MWAVGRISEGWTFGAATVLYLDKINFTTFLRSSVMIGYSLSKISLF